MRNDSQQRPPARSGRPLVTAILVTFVALLGVAAAQPRIVVSIHPYADLVSRLVGPGAEIVTLLPPGATPHGFEPTPRAVAAVSDADLVVTNGVIDAWVTGMIRGVGETPPNFVVLDVLAAEDAAGGHDPGGLGGVDPHVWLDPLRMVDVVPALAEALGAAIDAEDAGAYGAAGDTLVADLLALDDALRVTMAPVVGEPFVPFHGAWSLFAARYGLDLVLEIEPFPGREPSARELARAVDEVRATGARAVFTETQLADRPARVLAAEAGVAVGRLDPLGGVPGRERYEDLLRYNAERIVEALDDR